MVDKGINKSKKVSINCYAKDNNKHMKDCGKNKESKNLEYWNVNNLYGWKMSEKLLVNKFE